MTDNAASAAGRALAALRPRAVYQCPDCGQPFEAVATGGQRQVRYCPRCRHRRNVAAYRRRQRETRATQ